MVIRDFDADPRQGVFRWFSDTLGVGKDLFKVEYLQVRGAVALAVRRAYKATCELFRRNQRRLMFWPQARSYSRRRYS